MRTFRPPRDERAREATIVSSYAPDFSSDLTDAREAIEVMRIALERRDHVAFQRAYEEARIYLARVEAKLPVRGHMEDERDIYRVRYQRRAAWEIAMARRKLGRAQALRLREIAAGIQAKYILKAIENRYDVMKVAAVLIGWGKGWQGGLVSAEDAVQRMDADEAWRMAMKRVIGVERVKEEELSGGDEKDNEEKGEEGDSPGFPEFIDNNL
mgnify:CR=1 FL=1